MSLGEFLTNVSIILAVMAIGALIEVAVPMFVAKPWRDRRNANLGLTAVSFLSNWLLVSLAALAAVKFRPAGLLAAALLGANRVRYRHPYANLLTVYDRVLGTYTPSERARSIVYGLHNVNRVQASSFRGLLLMPFQPPPEPRSRDLAERQAEPPTGAARV